MSEPIALMVKKCVIVRLAHGPDHVSLVTNLPGATFPYTCEDLSLNFSAARGFGPEYVKEHFPGIEIEVEDTNAEDIDRTVAGKSAFER